MVRINLLPVREILRKRELKQFAIAAAAIMVVAVLGMVGTYWWLSTRISDLQAQKASEQRKLAELQKQNERINKLKAEIATLERQRDTIKQLTQSRDTPAGFMVALASAVPDEVWLTKIDKSGKTFSLQGQGLDNTVVVKFVENLQKVKKDAVLKRQGLPAPQPPNQPFFSSVKLVQTVRGGSGPGEIQFGITGTLH